MKPDQPLTIKCTLQKRGTYCYCYYYDLLRGIHVVKVGSHLAGATLCAFLCGLAIRVIPRENTAVIELV